jgi:hypothetical protein
MQICSSRCVLYLMIWGEWPENTTETPMLVTIKIDLIIGNDVDEDGTQRVAIPTLSSWPSKN